MGGGGTESPDSKKARTHAQASPPPPVVLVWDIDETLVIFNSLQNGEWERAHSDSGAGEAQALGSQWSSAVLDLADSHLFYKQLETHGVMSLEDAAAADDGRDLASYDFDGDVVGRIQSCEGPAPASNDPGPCTPPPEAAYRYREAHRRYSLGLLADAALPSSDRLWHATDTLAAGWLTAAQGLLAACLAHLPVLLGAALGTPSHAGVRDHLPQVRHVAVTSSDLLPSLAKLALFRLDRFFAGRDVLSSRVHGKLECFARLRDRFPGSAAFVAIGDGREEEAAAAALGWPFIKVSLGRCTLGRAEKGGVPLTSLTVMEIAGALGI
ncbi:EYA1 [Auxenochlorella protothecoides x Auxenochlorella symbiontica]